jgi:hypothetical protein
MRKFIFVATPLFFFITSFSQDVNSISLHDEFKSIEGFGKRQSGFEGIQTYSNHSVTGSQFFTDSWADGSVTSSAKYTLSKNFVFLYDKVRQELFMKSKDSNIVLLVDKSQIESFTINSDKPHVFVPASKYIPSLAGNFVETIIPTGNYQLLKLITTSFEKANMNDLEAVKQGDFSDKFIDHITYYVFHNNGFKEIKSLSEHNIRKALKDEAKKLDDFFEGHQNNEMNEEFLVMLINSLNS